MKNDKNVWNIVKPSEKVGNDHMKNLTCIWVLCEGYIQVVDHGSYLGFTPKYAVAIPRISNTPYGPKYVDSTPTKPPRFLGGVHMELGKGLHFHHGIGKIHDSCNPFKQIVVNDSNKFLGHWWIHWLLISLQYDPTYVAVTFECHEDHRTGRCGFRGRFNMDLTYHKMRYARWI